MYPSVADNLASVAKRHLRRPIQSMGGWMDGWMPKSRQTSLLSLFLPGKTVVFWNNPVSQINLQRSFKGKTSGSTNE